MDVKGVVIDALVISNNSETIYKITMKKLLVVLLSVFCVVNAKAQNSIQEQIDGQYVNASHKAFLYQVSPQNRTSDEWTLSAIKEYENAFKAKDMNLNIKSEELSPD